MLLGTSIRQQYSVKKNSNLQFALCGVAEVGKMRTGGETGYPANSEEGKEEKSDICVGFNAQN